MEDGIEVSEVCRFEDVGDGLEGFLVIGEIGEEDDAELVGGKLDDEGGEAAGAAGVEEEGGGAGDFEPAGCVVTTLVTGDGEAEAFKGGWEVDEFILLEGMGPFCIII